MAVCHNVKEISQVAARRDAAYEGETGCQEVPVSSLGDRRTDVCNHFFIFYFPFPPNSTNNRTDGQLYSGDGQPPSPRVRQLAPIDIAEMEASS